MVGVGLGWVALEPAGGHGRDMHLPLSRSQTELIGGVWGQPSLGTPPHPTRTARPDPILGTPRRHRAEEVSQMQSTLAELGSMFAKFSSLVAEQGIYMVVG